MKKIYFWISGICFVITILLMSYGCNQESNSKIVYELQERCGKRAEEVFKKEVGEAVQRDKDIGSITFNEYVNHFNIKLNKCFILITITSNVNDKENKINTSTVLKDLYDLNERKHYGSFVLHGSNLPNSGWVLEKQCKTLTEWNKLIKPYMEE